MVNKTAKQRALVMYESLQLEQMGFLRELVQRPSLRGETNEVQQFLASTLRDMGLQVMPEPIDIAQIQSLPGFSPVEWSYDGLFNVVARAKGSGHGGRSLLLNGHVDVVSPEPVSHWLHDPWGGAVIDGRMYGRGTADMKSGIAAMIFALHAILRSGVALRGDVLLETVIDEECSGNGTLSCLSQGHTADAALIPEATNFGFITAHPGVLWSRIKIRGAGSHAQSASSAVNAAEKAFVVIRALRELEAEWNAPARRHPSLASLEHPINLNIGILHAGDWPSNVPELCTMEVRLAYYPGVDRIAVEQELRERVAMAAMTDPWLHDHQPEVTFFGFRAEPAVYDLDADIFHVVADNHRAIIGAEVQAGPGAATIDSRFFALYFGIPSVCYGPSGGNLHAPDEWVDLTSVETCTRILIGTLIDWCGAV